MLRLLKILAVLIGLYYGAIVLLQTFPTSDQRGIVVIIAFACFGLGGWVANTTRKRERPQKAEKCLLVQDGEICTKSATVFDDHRWRWVCDEHLHPSSSEAWHRSQRP